VQLGELVKFCAPESSSGGLTMVKYIARMSKRVGDKIGLIIGLNDNSCVVLFDNDVIVLNTIFLEVVNEKNV